MQELHTKGVYARGVVSSGWMNALVLFATALGMESAHARDVEPLGYLDVTKAPYLADPTGLQDATAALQQALDASVAASKGVFIPAGRYRISNTLTCGKVVVMGSTRDPGQRSTLVLAANSAGFGSAATPKLVVHFPMDDAYNVTYDRMWASVDI